MFKTIIRNSNTSEQKNILGIHTVHAVEMTVLMEFKNIAREYQKCS